MRYISYLDAQFPLLSDLLKRNPGILSFLESAIFRGFLKERLSREPRELRV
jgi:hypothetical protein